MRLTLRTLLAWLDDTLPAHEVRQIGKQVAESPFAQELVDRTYRVTRQRRLLVPPSSGPDATDPNVVSAYLDNELPAEQVADYEKKCLTSDVNLAEVASVHQILSLIGQKAKVPPDAKARMYRLVKGRESAYTHDAVRRTTSPPEPVSAIKPPSPRPEPWSPPTMPGRPLAERLGIGAVVLGLLAVIGWSAYSTLSPDGEAAHPRLVQAEPAPPPPPPEVAPVAPAEPAPAAEPPKVAAPAPAPAPDAGAMTGAEAKSAAPTAARLATALTLLLAWDGEKAAWSRVTPVTAIRPGTRLANLAPFWSTVQADAARITLVDESEATFLSGKGQALKLDFDRGRVILAGGADGPPHVVTFAGQPCSISCSPGALVGLQRIWTLTPGVARAEPPPVTIFVDGGKASFQVGDSKKTLKGPAIATWAPAGAIEISSRSAMPPWMTESAPPPSARELGERFLKDFSADGPVLRDLVQAVDGEDPDVRRLAIHALGAIGEAEMIVPVLNNAMTDPASRRAAADVLRGMLARGGDAAKSVREELAKVFGEALAGPAEKLLVGYTAEEGARESTYVDLIQMLTTPELGTRELALQSLMGLTGRDNMEYDPTRPEGRGLRAWQELILQRKELNKANPAAPR